MDQKKRQLDKEQEGNISFVPNYGELITWWAMHQAFGMHCIIQFSHGNPIIQI